jgi:hypothetical protein
LDFPAAFRVDFFGADFLADFLALLPCFLLPCLLLPCPVRFFAMRFFLGAGRAAIGGTRSGSETRPSAPIGI